MQGISTGTLLLFAAAIAGQVIGVTTLPRTAGFTNAPFTILALAAFDVSLLFCARLLTSGVNLVGLVPIMSASVPLISVACGILLYGEGASLLKVAVLVVACGLVGVASRLQ
jgi:small multidrug resistance pump